MPAKSKTKLTAAEKVTLFRRLFRGRDDVYPKRWTSRKTGAKGYSPACANEWVAGVCDKGRVRCSNCTHRSYLPITDRVVLDHLQGRHVIGVYPLLTDDTCWFLAVDFDRGDWKADVGALVQTCADVGVPVAVERSRSGQGAHAWFFFSAPVPAVTARKLGSMLITETMTRRYQLSMSSYDRMFPNQDAAPRGGFGNLIALPLQHGPRQLENSVFVDTSWQPHPDQWNYLSRCRRIEPHTLSKIEASTTQGAAPWSPATSVDEAYADAPWDAPPSGRARKTPISSALPAQAHAVLRHRLFVEKQGLPSSLLSQLKRLAAFHNPEFYERQQRRLSTSRTPRIISCSEDHPKHLSLPRGCLDAAEQLLQEHGGRLDVRDAREVGQPLEARFRGKISPWQDKALRALLAHDTGVIVAPPGSGKTVLGAKAIAARGSNTLVLVHRRQLVDQWNVQLQLFLELQEGTMGVIYAGRRNATGTLDVATYQSLVTSTAVDDMVANYGHVVVDECHHVPARSFERLLSAVRARFITGLTATPRRRDGLDPIHRMQLGPVCHTVHRKEIAALQPFAHELVVRSTDFDAQAGETGSLAKLLTRLASDDCRNALIVSDVAAALDEGRCPLVLTERREHLEILAALLLSTTANVITLRGGMKKAERRAVMAKLEAIGPDEERVVLATGRYAGEGFDDPRLDTLFLALPVSWKGTLVQYAGRLHRRHYGKRCVRVFDYVDQHVPQLRRMFGRRLAGYRAMGYVAADERTRDSQPRSAADHHQLAIGFDVVAEQGRASSCADAVPPDSAVTREPRHPTRELPPEAEIRAMIDDVLAEAFTLPERAAAFFELLADELELPFAATLRGKPVQVEQLRLSPRDHIVAVCTGDSRRRPVRLTTLVPEGSPLGWEWVEAYRRWRREAE